MTVKWLALVLVLGSACSAQAQQYGGPCEPERTINALANAVTRAPPLVHETPIRAGNGRRSTVCNAAVHDARTLEAVVDRAMA